MAGQPLAWMEASNLPEEAFDLKPLVDAYRTVQHDFHRGTILPVGDEPSGRSWTGFQSLTSDNEGYLLVYREDNPRNEAEISTWFSIGDTVKLSPVIGNGNEQSLRAGEGGRIKLTIDKPHDFVLYKYSVAK